MQLAQITDNIITTFQKDNGQGRKGLKAKGLLKIINDEWMQELGIKHI